MSRPEARSLRRWLSWWLAGQTLLALGIVCFGVYVATSFSLAARQTDELQQKEQVVRHLMSEVDKGGGFSNLTHKLDDFLVGHRNLRLTLKAGNGALLYSSANAPALPPTQVRWARFDTSSMLVAAGVVKAELMLDTSADALVLKQLAWTLLACAMASALVVSTGGVWLVQRVMAPVRKLVDQTQTLRADSLSQRLDGSGQAEELQPLVEQFNALLGRLEDAYVQMEGFNADVAHELRTPLATLIGECELALSNACTRETLQEVIGSNLEELHRLTAVVNTMLFLSQAARGSTARRLPVPSLALIASEVVEFHDASLQEAGLQVAVVGDADGAFDAPLLRQALSNLLANATRFADHGSTVEIRIGNAPRDTVDISVMNAGPEIDAAHLPRLFDRFYRVDPAREHGDANHGLGLSIVAAIARMHGGRTHAQSKDGHTSIAFRLIRECSALPDAHAADADAKAAPETSRSG